MIRRTFLLLALCAAAACSDSTGVDFEGRYDLRTINGVGLPATIVIQGGTLVMQSGFIELDSDESFVLGLTATTSASGSQQTQTTTRDGVWSQEGNTVFLDYSDGSTDTRTINGNELSVESEGLVFVFRQ